MHATNRIAEKGSFLAAAVLGGLALWWTFGLNGPHLLDKVAPKLDRRVASQLVACEAPGAMPVAVTTYGHARNQARSLAPERAPCELTPSTGALADLNRALETRPAALSWLLDADVMAPLLGCSGSEPEACSGYSVMTLSEEATPAAVQALRSLIQRTAAWEVRSLARASGAQVFGYTYRFADGSEVHLMWSQTAAAQASTPMVMAFRVPAGEALWAVPLGEREAR